MIAVTVSDNLVGLRRPTDRLAHRASRVALPLALGIALVVRVLRIARAPGILDGDEALVGIQAERIAAGAEHPLPVFFYGQPYMGALEAYLAAGLFRLVGPSVQALRLVPLFFALLLVVLTYELARRVAGRPAASVAALLAALPPLYVGVWSVKARGGYVETLALGSALLIATHRLLYGPSEGLGLTAPVPGGPRRTYGWWLLWGAVAGLMFWVSPLSVYYILTGAGALVVAALRRHHWRPHRRDLRTALPPLGLILAGALAGGLPLWVDNVYTRGATFGYLFGGSPGRGSSLTRVAGVATYFVHAVLPKLAGAWEPWVTANSRRLGAIVLALYALSALYLVVRLLAGRRGVLGYRGRPRHGQGLLLAFAGVVAALVCVNGLWATALNPYGFDAASRYALPLAGVLPVAAGALLWRMWRLWAPLGAAALAALLLTNATGYALARPPDVFQSEYWSKLPPTEAPLAFFLERNGIRDVWMNHWAGYPLMFYADGRVTAADYNDVAHLGVNRLPWAMRRVAADPHAAYVLVTSETHPPLEGLLRGQGVHFKMSRVGPYLVFWDLSRPVAPGTVKRGIGFSY